MKLSICMMVKNEESNLTRCLSSLELLRKSLDSELIILDTGSDDETVEVARRFTDKVYIHPWNGNFAEMRNKSIEYAKGEWLLIIDADEEMEDPKALIEFLSSDMANKYKTCSLIIKNLLVGEKWSLSILPRMFKNDDFEYTGVIHEQPSLKGPFWNLETALMHYGYFSSDKALMERKFVRNRKYLIEALEKEPENIYYMYQLGQTYCMHGDRREGNNAYIKAYRIAQKRKVPAKNLLPMHPRMVRAYVEQGKLEVAEKACLEGIKEDKNYVDLVFYMAKIKVALKKYQEAINYYLKYLDLVRNYSPSFMSIFGFTETYTLERKTEAYIDLASIYLEQERFDLALDCLEETELEEETSRQFDAYITVWLKMKNFSTLYTFYTQKVIEMGKEFEELFLTKLENLKDELDGPEDRNALFREFSAGTDGYGILNQIRLAFENGEEMSGFSVKASKEGLEFNKPFCRDFIYFAIKLGHPLDLLFEKIRSNIAFQHLSYLATRYKDLDNLIFDYLVIMDSSKSFRQIRLGKILRQFLLLRGNTQENQYWEIFKEYVKNGISYVKRIYSVQVIEDELIFEVNDEDGFLIYLARAEGYQNNELKYIEYLRKALKTYPCMRKGIELLMEESRQRFEEKNKIRKEFDRYRTQVTTTINHLIDTGKLNEAENIISEYQNIVGDDEDVSSLLERVRESAENTQ